MPAFSFTTILEPTESVFKEKGSKFLSFAYPATSEEDVKQKLELLRKKYFDASHHCYAFMLGAEKLKYKAHDDGEPNHSAGDPILGQIRSKNLTNVLVVVVRYFGGTKLGVSGLIQAYRTAAEDVLNKASIVEVFVTEKMRLTYPYTSTPEIMKLIKDHDAKILSQAFTDQCNLEVEVKLFEMEKMYERLHLLKALGHPISFSMTD